MPALDQGRPSGFAVGLLLLGFVGCQKPPLVPSAGPTETRHSDKTDRRDVAVTVYNQNFGVVRETRRLRLARGKVELAYQDVAANIQPETVRLRSTTPGARFGVLEQNYRYDLLTPAKLLEKYVGRTINVYRYDQKTGTETKKTAEVLSVEGGVTLRIDGEVTTSFEGRYGFREVPRNLLEKPTLVWLVESDRAEQQVEVTYITQNLNWHADYVLQLGADDAHAQLTGWVTLSNNSGVSYENATLKLVAGDVNRAPPPTELVLSAAARDDVPAQEKSAFAEQGLFEYHLYTLGRPTSLLDKETKQVALLSADRVAVTKKLVLNGDKTYYRGRYEDDAPEQKVGVFIELENREQNQLGVPLPKGTVRLYKADASGASQFLGEDAIDHTPRGEKLLVKVGDAFDVVAERKQTDWLPLGSCSSEAALETELRNHKDGDVQVEVNERVGGEWEVLTHSQPFVEVDSSTVRFDVKVPARGSAKLTYRIRVRYC